MMGPPGPGGDRKRAAPLLLLWALCALLMQQAACTLLQAGSATGDVVTPKVVGGADAPEKRWVTLMVH